MYVSALTAPVQFAENARHAKSVASRIGVNLLAFISTTTILQTLSSDMAIYR